MKKVLMVWGVIVTMVATMGVSAADMTLSHKIATEMTESNEIFMEVKGEGVSEGASVNVVITDMESADNEKVFITQLYGNKDNQIEIKIDLEKKLKKSGRYLFKAAAQNGLKGEFNFTYTRHADIVEIVSQINAIKENSGYDSVNKATKIKEYLESGRGKSLASNISPVVKEVIDNGKTEMLARFLISEDITLDNALTAFVKTSSVVVIPMKNASETESLFETYASQLNLEANVPGYKEAPDNQKERIYSRLSDATLTSESMNEFYKEVLEMLALAKLDIAQGSDKILSILKAYPQFFNLTIYNSADNDKAEMLTKIEKAFETKKDLRAVDVQKILDTKITKTQTGSVGSTGGSGGKGGANKGGGGVSVGSAYIGGEKIDFENTVEYKGVGFSDLTGYEWARDSINELAGLGVLNGYSENVFAPQDNVTRAQLCKMICKLFGIREKNDNGKFIDVGKGEWYFGFVNAMYRDEIVNGVDDERFAPDEFVTRQDAAVMIFRAIEKYGQINASEQTMQFADSTEISEYAVEACNALKDNGIIQGKGENKFVPFENMTRAETAKMMSNVYRFIEEGR